MIETLIESCVEQNYTEPKEQALRCGFSDWKQTVEALGNRSLAHFIEVMDPGNPSDGVNAHRVIAERLHALGLPYQKHVVTTVEDFASKPDDYYSQLHGGDFFFVSIRPGTHLAHTNDKEQVTSFVNNFARNSTEPGDLQQEVYLGRSGEPVLSGHIIVRNAEGPSPIYAEFTNGNFNAFHRGFQTPEILLHRNAHRFEWQFRGDLEPSDSDWRTGERFLCNGDVWLSRPEIAQKIYESVQLLPHDGDYYLPGYYEVLIERTNAGTRPVFIGAVTDKRVSVRL